MKRPRVWIFAGALLLAVLSPAPAAEAPPRIPLETFFAEADCRDMRLSPDGKHVAFLAVLGYGKVGIALLDLATGKYDALVSAKDENIKAFFWKGSDYIVYGGDIGGNESGAWRSIAVASPKAGQKRKVITLSEAYVERYNEKADFMNIVDEMPTDPNRVLAWGIMDQGNGRRDTAYFGGQTGFFYLDVRDGRRRPVEGLSSNDERNDTIVPDNRGTIRARLWMEQGKVRFGVCADQTGRFTAVREFPADAGGWAPVCFGSDNETLYIYDTEKSDAAIVRTYNIRTQALGAPLFQTPAGEPSALIFNSDRSKLYGVRYEEEKAVDHYLDAAWEQIQRSVETALPGPRTRIVDFSDDEKVLLILASSDCDPGTYYILDRVKGRMGAIGKVRSNINPAHMRPMESISFTARDGLTIHGYLTRPANPAGGPTPLILLPHGGPFGIRDTWGFDPEVQFLANRGYAVLQVNYRGSGGYGEVFQQAGYHEWGGKMQDDLTDAVKWAVAQGIADPARVAIYGASYGGYATLAGLVFTPELYCCGANYVGASDLALLVGRNNNVGRNEWRDFFYERMVGKDKQYLFSRSPVNFIENLRVPLFNAYGENDPRVDISHWKRLEAKLKQFKKTYEIMLVDNEGHGFYNEQNRLVYYRKLEAFFDRYLAPGRSGGAAAPKSGQ